MALPRVLFVTPIRPGLPGSGLAHRAAAWQRALGAVADLDIWVVPVADPGAAAASPPPGCTVVRLPDAGERVEGALAAMRSPEARALLAEFDVAVPQVTAAPPWLGAAEATRRPPADPYDVVVCCRSYLLPFVAGALQGTAANPGAVAPLLVVDLDDDDAAFHRARGDEGTAAAFEHLVARAQARGAVLTAAGRHAVDVVPLPNCVDGPWSPSPAPEGAGRLLFVGNLTYGPNADGLDWYVREVHPRVLVARPDSSLRVVGPGGRRWAGVPGVDVAGTVADLGAEYAAAQVVVAPVRVGSGTRIKVIEAWAHERPVVATQVAVDGLACTSGREVVVRDQPAEFAAAVVSLLDDPAAAAAVARAGRALAVAQYSSDLFDRIVAGIVRPTG